MNINDFLALADNRYPLLTSLSLDFNEIWHDETNRTLKRCKQNLVAIKLIQCTQLTSLSLNGLRAHALQKKTLTKFINSLKANEKIIAIDFKDIKFEMLSDGTFSDLIDALPNIQRLGLHKSTMHNWSHEKQNIFLNFLFTLISLNPKKHTDLELIDSSSAKDTDLELTDNTPIESVRTTFLEHMDLSEHNWSSLRKKTCRKLVKALGTKLKYLDLRDTLDENLNRFEYIVQLIENSTELNHLNLSLINFSKASIAQLQALGQALQTTKIHTLIINNVSLGACSSEKIKVFFDELAKCEFLETLDLGSNYFSSIVLEGLEHLNEFIKKSKIKNLLLTECALDECFVIDEEENDPAILLQQKARTEQILALIQNCHHLRALDLEGNDVIAFPEDILISLGNILASKKLLSLNLANICLGAIEVSHKIFKAFTLMISKLTTLEHLDLSFNPIPDMKTHLMQKLINAINQLKLKTLALDDIEAVEFTKRDFNLFFQNLFHPNSNLTKHLKNLSLQDDQLDTLKPAQQNLLVNSLIKCIDLRQIHGLNNLAEGILSNLYAGEFSPLILSSPVRQPKLGPNNAQILLCFYASLMNFFNSINIPSDVQRKIFMEFIKQDVYLINGLLNNPQRVIDRSTSFEVEKFFPCGSKQKTVIFSAKQSANTTHQIATNKRNKKLKYLKS